MAGKAEFLPRPPCLDRSSRTMQGQRHCRVHGSNATLGPSHQEVDMALVEEVAEEAGIENPEDLLNEAVHHDHDEDATLTVDELQSAAEVVVAQQDVLREVEEAQPEETAIPEPVEPEIDIDALVEAQPPPSKMETQRTPLSSQTASENHRCPARRAWRRRRDGQARSRQPCHCSDDARTKSGTNPCTGMV